MSSGIEKYKVEERIRRLFFKHRGDVLAVIQESGLDGDYVRKVTDKISKRFKRDVNLEIACFVTESILSGREQRLILMEERLKELLNRKELRSICHDAEVAENTYDESIWYKCKKCGENCEVRVADLTEDLSVVRYIDRMRKEDEAIGKFLATMGFIAKADSVPLAPGTKQVNIGGDVNVVHGKDTEFAEQLKKLPGPKLTELRRFVESTILEEVENSSDEE